MAELTYKIEIAEQSEDHVLLKIGFGRPADNTEIVAEAKRLVEALNLKGGRLVKLNGPASLPVAMVLCHAVAHLFKAVAVFDPKMNQYVVCVSHDPDLSVGQTVS